MAAMIKTLLKICKRDSPATAIDTLGLDVLELFSGFDASDPRDNIFALWGLVNPDGPHAALIRPNYSASVADVYVRAARYIISVQGRLELLESHSHGLAPHNELLKSSGLTIPTTTPLDLPSWVPDWQNFLLNPNGNSD